MFYEREAELTVAPKDQKAVRITGLRIAFSINLVQSANPNQSQIKVYNLSKETRELFSRKDWTKVILKVGYVFDEGLKTIFKGDLGLATDHYEGTDLVTTMRLIEGGNFHKNARGSFTLLKGHKYSLAVRKCAAMGVDIDEVFPVLKTPVLDKTLQTDFSFTGQATDGLDLLAKKLDAQWGIHNQQIQVLPDLLTVSKTAVLLTPSTGLIGIPSKSTDQGFNLQSYSGDFIRSWEVTSLLQPDIYVGMPIKLESKIVEGTFSASSVTHIGDTRGDNWHTKMSITQIAPGNQVNNGGENG